MDPEITLARLSKELGRAILTIADSLRSHEKFAELMVSMGWSVTRIPSSLQPVTAAIDSLSLALDAFENQESPTITDLEQFRRAIGQVFAGLRDLDQASFEPTLAAADFGKKFRRQIIDLAILRWLEQEYPGLAYVGYVLGIFTSTYVASSPERPAYIDMHISWPEISRLLSSPRSVFESTYMWGTSDFDSGKLLRNLQDAALSLGVQSSMDFARNQHILQLNEIQQDEAPAARMHLEILIAEGFTDQGYFKTGFRVLNLAEVEDKLPGLAILPFATEQLRNQFSLTSHLTLRINSDLDLQGGVGFIFRPNERVRVLEGIDRTEGSALVAGGLGARLAYKNLDNQPTTLLSSLGGAKLQIADGSVDAGLIAAGQAEPELFLEVNLENARLAISSEGDDDFLAAILPNGLQANFDTGVGVSSKRGFYLRGSSSLEATFPTHFSHRSIKINSITTAIHPSEERIRADIGASIQVMLGPLVTIIENVGFSTEVQFRESDGNLGPVNFDLSFKPPDGVGISIDSSGFKGGGFLKFEPDQARYVGILELEYQNKIALKAIGLLTTRLPGGESGFSLLILITAEFNPIQLGYGFTLNGVGGLLGLNRGIRIERLRNGIRDNTLSSVLFPPDPVANAHRIISDLRQVFPAQAGRFVFGPMGKLGWGTPTLITLDVGLALEVPEPVTLALLGVLKAQLPDEKNTLLQLQVNFLGVIDFEKEHLSFDATIYDSKLLSFPLSGDMAVRLNWGGDPNFLLTVGGFHPAYEPPPIALPTLTRMTVQLLSGKNPRLTLESYFAITSNTAQFGAKIELYAGAGSFNVYGILAFDTLFQFSPFYFVAVVNAMLALRRGSKSIASISLSLNLEGTTPWKANGTATLKLCWFIKIKVRFNKTFGRALDTRLDDLNVLPLITAALQAPGNWEARLPARRHMLVSLKEIDTTGNKIVAHPFGVLAVSQKVVPLNVKIDTVGHQQPRDGNEFRITDVRVNGQAQTPSAAKEYFAPGQFFRKSDAEKLSGKSFEQYDSGIRLSDTEAFESDHVVKRDVSYELSYIDSQRDLPQPRIRVAPPLFIFNAWTSGGAIAKSPLSHARTRKFALAPEAVRVGQESFAVVTVDGLAPAEVDHVRNSEAEALAYMQEIIAQKPSLAGRLQAIPAFELN